MDTYFGLFFPYFHFPSDGWVKLSALYWDKLYRIVPYEVETNDTTTIKLLSNKESGFIGRIYPEDHPQVLNKIQIDLMKLVENHQQELEKYYGIKNIQFWARYPFLDKNFFKKNPHIVELHSLKLVHGLDEYLIDRGLGMRIGRYGLGLHPLLANVYMSALAEGLAVKTKSHPVTSDVINYFAVGGYSFERFAQILLGKVQITEFKPMNDEMESCLATIAIKAVMPKNIEKVSVDDIMKIREKNISNMGKFQKFIRETLNSLPGLADVEGMELIDHLDTVYSKTIKPKVDELDDAINSVGSETVPLILNMQVKVPSILGVGGLLAGATIANPVLGATAGVALALLKIISDKRKEIKEKIKKSDVAYLLNIREELTPIGSLEGLNIKARNALFGI